jgi:mannose-6-phosphate isomerase
MLLTPFLLDRKFLPKVWGGRTFESVLGMPLPVGGAIGETWELYHRPDESSRLRGSDRTLADLMREMPTELLGRGVKPGRGGLFPLLLKFIDAREALSVQVHPDDVQAQADGDSGKDEAWVVLHAGPNARIIRGLRPGVERAEFEANAHTAEVEKLLWMFTPRAGDCVHLPPGTVHALGPDVVVFEVQQNSDLTYRLYDWGRPREVHVQKALAVTRIEGARSDTSVGAILVPAPLSDGGLQLVATDNYRLRRYALQQQQHVLATNHRFAAVTVVHGRGTLDWHSGEAHSPLPLVAGDTVLVPAAVEHVVLSPIGRLDVLVSDPGEC